MISKTTPTLSACLLTFTILFQQSALASTNPDKDASLQQKVKAGISKLGVGDLSTVSLRLRDKTKVEGYISEIRDETFVVTEPASGRSKEIAYPDVVQVNGNNLTTKTKV